MGNKNNVIDIDSHLPHKVTKCICGECGKKWVSVCPETVPIEELECPKCHQQGNTTVDNIIQFGGGE